MTQRLYTEKELVEFGELVLSYDRPRFFSGGSTPVITYNDVEQFRQSGAGEDYVVHEKDESLSKLIDVFEKAKTAVDFTKWFADFVSRGLPRDEESDSSKKEPVNLCSKPPGEDQSNQQEKIEKALDRLQEKLQEELDEMLESMNLKVTITIVPLD